MKRFLLAIFIVSSFFVGKADLTEEKKIGFWEIAAIDTMKYSRDLAKRAHDDPDFDEVIDRQVGQIAETGATHVAIATPYDAEFVPVLTRWVAAARRYNLKVWFRGNFSGWEKWFGYKAITRDEHLEKTKAFILSHTELFVDGDVFNSCTECENGGPGDPRATGDVAGHRAFLIKEYQVTQEAFNKIGRLVASNFASMNADVARLVMDRETAREMGGLVVIDHYVASSENTAKDIREIAESADARIVLGEFGAPVFDIHGNMSEEEQAKWIEKTLTNLINVPQLVGVNYWVNMGGSTGIWFAEGKEKKAVAIIRSFYKPKQINGVVKNKSNQPIANAEIIFGKDKITTNKKGEFQVPFASPGRSFRVSKPGFDSVNVSSPYDEQKLTITLNRKSNESWFEILLAFWGRLFNQ